MALEIASVKKDHATITAALIQPPRPKRSSARTSRTSPTQLEALKGAGGRHQAVARRRGAACWPKCSARCSAWGSTRRRRSWSSRRTRCLGAERHPARRRGAGTAPGDRGADRRPRRTVAASRPRSRPNAQRLTAAVGEQFAEKQRLALLLEEKQKLQGEREAALGAEQKRSEELADKAGSLKELIASLEKQAAAGREGAAAEAEQERREAELAALPVPEANRLARSAAVFGAEAPDRAAGHRQIERRFGAR